MSPSSLSHALQPYTLKREVMFYDTDIGGVVHNLAYLRHIEEARTLMAAQQLGLDMPHMAKEQLYPVLVSTEIQYLKPATLGDTLIIQGQLTRIQRARFWVEFQILPKAKGNEAEIAQKSSSSQPKPFVTCQQALSLVQMPEGKVQRLNQGQWREWKLQLEAAETKTYET